jgi:hypothetical protein
MKKLCITCCYQCKHLTSGRISSFPGYSFMTLGRCSLMPESTSIKFEYNDGYKYDIFDPRKEIPDWCPLEDI